MLPPNRPHAASAEASPAPSGGRALRSSPPKSRPVSPPTQQSLPLGLGLASSAPPGKRKRARRLWLCLHFPLLPLEALNGENDTPPYAVFEESRGLRQVLLANDAARAAGIIAGMPANAALALQPALILEERDPSREERALKELAAWAECFTSTVSLDPPALLLELAGSLRLFGGLDTLCERIAGDLGRRDFRASMALAPTPLAALWLARGGRNVRVESLKHLTGAVAPLPFSCTMWPEEVQENLSGMGLTCIGDCLRLPRQGFARRFGASRLLELDRALGRLPDPRVSYRKPARFCRECELSEELDDSELLLAACRKLLEALERFLVERQLAAREVRFSFFHLRAKTTPLVLRRREAGGGLEQWSRLLALRFENTTLPAPVIAVRLATGPGEPLEGKTASLPFDGKPDRVGTGSTPVAELVERLAARMGDDAIEGLTLVAEHRPQLAWRSALPGDDRTPRCPAPAPPDACHPQGLDDLRHAERLLRKRPLWMLPEPLRLETHGGAPSHDGPLTLLSGPERIETGWWDEQGIARDYFVAVDQRGAQLWIYRDRRAERGWYLHGMFG